MKFWASSESFKPADQHLERARCAVEPYINACLERSSISDIDLTIRYIPIVMPSDMHKKYKERSVARISKRIYDCAPYLDYNIFLHDNFSSQVHEYIRGLSSVKDNLKKFGLDAKQILEFGDILIEAQNALPVIGPSRAMQ